MRIVQTALVIAVGLAGCQKPAHAPAPPAADGVTADADPIPVTQDDDGEPWPILSTEFLDLVPAETPYLFAHTQPIPADVVAKLEPLISPLAAAFEEGIAKEAKSTDAEDKRLLEELFGGPFSIAGLKKIGIDLNPRFVIYGLGFAPVLRMRLADAPTFERAIERMNAASSRPMDISTFHAQRYFHSQSADGSLTAISIVGPDLVFTILPPGDIQRELLPLAFGQKLPAKSIAADGRFAKLLADRQLGPHFSGYVDIGASLIAIYGHGDDLNRRVAASYPSLAKPRSAECVADALRVAAAVPRLTFGYEEVSTKRLVATATLDLDDALTHHSKTVAGPIPGLGDKRRRGTITTFGLGIDTKELLAAASAYTKAVTSEPFRCSDFLALNDAGQALSAAPAFVPKPLLGITGFSTQIDDAGVADDQRLDGVLVVGVDDPKGALAALGQLATTLAVDKLRKPRTPVPLASLLPTGAAPPALVDNAWVAYGKKSIGVAFGKVGKKGLLAVLDKQRRNDGTFALWAMDLAPWIARHPEVVETSTDPNVRMFVAAFVAIFGQSSFAIRTTNRGFEMKTTMELPKR